MRTTLIIGGTGTLGRALLETMDPREVIVFSRDELKQNQLRRDFPGVRCVLGDIRDRHSLERAYDLGPIMRVFHVAALKHVDVLEENPEEAYKTNVLGTVNSAEVAKARRVRAFYFTSTDKAVLPVNCYGMTKGIAERILLNYNRTPGPQFKVFRWGNIIGSRGSVVGYFAKTIKDEGKVYITDLNMTRFWMRIEDAVKYMLSFDGPIDQVNYPPMKAASVVDLAGAVAEAMGEPEPLPEVTGIRPGEKIHECMWSSHDGCLRSDTAEQFTREELVALVKPVLDKL